MRVAAVLAVLVLGTEPEKAHDRAVQLADAMQRAMGKMVHGVEAYLSEVNSAEAESAAHAFVDGVKASASKSEDKGTHMAEQMLRNLKSLSAAADALKVAARELKAAPAAKTDGEQEGELFALRSKVTAQKAAIEELEDEKRSLATSVATLMHRGADSDLKQQVADVRKQLVQTQADAKTAAEKAAAEKEQLTSNSDELTASLQSCQSDQKSQSTGKVQESITKSEVQCSADLAKAKSLLSQASNDHDSMVQTVQMMVKTSDELKAKLKAKTDCAVSPIAAVTAPPAETIDIAHMGETVKIDAYVAKEEAAKELHTPLNATVPVRAVKFHASSVREAKEALAGRGDIGKYLRGSKDDTKADDVDAGDLEQQIDALMPEDEDVLKAADAVGTKYKKGHGFGAAPAKAPASDGNFSEKLLLQAEQTLKLAA